MLDMILKYSLKNKVHFLSFYACTNEKNMLKIGMAITPNKRKSTMPNATLENVISVLNETPNGANIILEWERPVKTKKAHSDLNIRKHVRMVGRKGINYENIQSVKAKRDEGIEAKPTWFYHDENCKGIIRNKRTDEPYVQLFVGTSDKVHPHVSFTMDGEETNMDEIESFILASEKRSEKGETFTCKIANMIRIHQEIGMDDIGVEPQTSEAETEQTADA
jgi:hypothetical protein